MIFYATPTLLKIKSKSGSKIISGYTKKEGVPCRAIVRIYERNTALLLGQCLSGDDGFYIFKGLKNLPHMVIAITSLNFNAVIQDNVVPK